MNNFLFQCTEKYLESKQDFVVSTIKQLADDVGNTSPSIISLKKTFDDDSDKVLFRAVEKLNTIIDSNGDIVSFFEKLCRSETMEDDITTAVRTIEWKDTNTVRKIEPQYLIEYVSQIAVIIDDMLKGDIDEAELNSITSDEYCETMKRNLVRKSLDTTFKIDDCNISIPKRDCLINDMFIKNTVLPFVQCIHNIKDEINTERDGIIEAIDVTKDKITLYRNTLQNMNIKGNIAVDKLTALNKFLFNAGYFLQECLYYMTYMLILKSQIYLHNIAALVSLKNRTDKKTSEHLTSNMTRYITDDDAMDDMISGSASTILDTINMILNKQYSGYSVDNHTNSNFIDVNIASASYDENIYESVREIFNAINTGIINLSKNIKDRFIAFDVVIDKCGFSDNLTTRFNAILSSIDNIDIYTKAFGKISQDKLFFCLMKELSVAEESYWRSTGDLISDTYKNIIHFREDITNNINNEYPNRTLNSEMIEFSYQLETNFKDMVVLVGKNFISRYNKIDSFASSLHGVDDIVIDIDAFESSIPLDDTDYTESVDELYLEFVSGLSDINIRYANQYYNEAVIRDTYGFLMEDTPTNDTQNTNGGQSNGGSTTQNGDVTVTQNENQMSDADKQQNNEASGNASNTNSSQSDDKKKATFKEKIKMLREKIKKFFGTIGKKWANMINKLRGRSIEWINANKEAILGRSFNGVALKMPPYDGYDPSNILRDMATLGNTITSLSDTDIKAFTDANSIYQKLLPNINPNGAEYKEYLQMYYQFGKEVPKDANGKYTPVEYKNTALKTLTEKMIAFCEEYYNTGSDALGKESENIRSKLDSKLGSVEGSLSIESAATVGKISFCVQTITGVMMNAYRNRCNDFMKALHGLVPKKTKQQTPENPADNNGANEDLTTDANAEETQSAEAQSETDNSAT